MKYVYLENSVVTDIARVDPYTIFYPNYASQFIEAPDEVTFGWLLVDGTWTPPPAPTPEEIQAENKSTATSLLQQTDWTTIPDVSDPALSDPYLTNATEFAEYRSNVRKIAVNPPATSAVFPTMPDEVWAYTNA